MTGAKRGAPAEAGTALNNGAEGAVLPGRLQPLPHPGEALHAGPPERALCPRRQHFSPALAQHWQAGAGASDHASTRGDSGSSAETSATKNVRIRFIIFRGRAREHAVSRSSGRRLVTIFYQETKEGGPRVGREPSREIWYRAWAGCNRSARLAAMAGTATRAEAGANFSWAGKARPIR